MRMKKTLALFLMVLLSTSLLAGCGGDKGASKEGSSTPKAGGKLVVALAQVPNTLDPVKYTGTYESNVMFAIFNTLVVYDQTLSEIQPSLATKWSVSSDMTEYTFELRDDAYFQKGKFQDGRKMTAEDVKYSLERSAKESAMKRLRMLKSVTVLDGNKIKITIDKPNAAFLAVLTDRGNSIVCREEVEGWKEQFGQHPVGTGPFTFVSWAKDDNITLARNEKYFGGKPNLDTLVWRFIPNPNMMVNAVRTGEIDIATRITGPDRETIKKDSNLIMLSVPGMNVTFVGMNMQNGPTANIKVREAIAAATNADEIVNAVFKWGGAVRSYGPVPAASWGYNPAVKDMAPKFDLSKAKQLMKEAGYENGFKVTIVTPQDDNRIKLATIMQTQLKAINIDVEVKSMEWGSFSDTVAKGKADMYTLAWSWYPDPDFFLYQMFDSRQFGTLANGQGYKNDKVDALIRQATESAGGQEARTKIYQDIQALISKDVPRVEAWSLDEANVIKKRVHGYKVSADGLIRIVTNGINVWVD
ncbi:MAG: extracellular solute-binding protein family 5 [Firmicutes bacterium]|nr:extracellular solute-binding protein family 5 [Bacillota bacterium]